MSRFTFAAFLVLIASQAEAHEGAHMHPHGFGEAVLLVVLGAALALGAYWFGRGGK